MQVPWRRLEVARVNKVRTAEESGRRAQRAVRRDKKRQEAIKKAGIDYEYTPLSAKLPPKPVHQKFDD